VPLQLRVDVKILPKSEVDGILDGEGYPDLSISSLSMSRPRAGMQGNHTLDLSDTGMGLQFPQVYEKGTAAALDLHLPGDRTVVKLLGEVMWSAQAAGASRVGIRFAALDEDSAQRFSGYLGSLA
jgi:hypothetical protein